MAILEDRGIFWWNDELVPQKQFAPNTAIGGKLIIEESGAIRLELDSVLPRATRRASIPDEFGQSVSQNIQGLLTNAGHVLLLNTFSNGSTFNTRNLSRESYVARQCLVSEGAFKRDGKNSLKFRELSVDLAGFEEWLWLKAIEVDRRKNRLSAKYKSPKEKVYQLPFAKMKIEYDLSGPYFIKSRYSDLKIRQMARLKFMPSSQMPLGDCQLYFQYIEELLILLTSVDYNLGWPRVTPVGSRHRATLYYSRHRSEAKAPRAHECLINFPAIEDAFGDLLAAYVESRELYGPGIYLYLGTRRGMEMFVEHRFVNLIWGLEAFDRYGRVENDVSQPINEKITRILSQISSGKDRRWLCGRLKYASEPSLSERLLGIFSSIPLSFNHDELKKFCKDCQDRRNDISHFGGVRQKNQKYDDFMRDIDKKSNALSALYHLHLLNAIGVKKERLEVTSNHSFPLSRMVREIRAVGILKEQEAT